MLKAEYQTRGPVPQDVIEAVPFENPGLEEGQVLLEMLAAPINPSDVLTLTGQYGILPPLPAVGGSEGVAKVVEHDPGVAPIKLGIDAVGGAATARLGEALDQTNPLRDIVRPPGVFRPRLRS